MNENKAIYSSFISNVKKYVFAPFAQNGDADECEKVLLRSGSNGSNRKEYLSTPERDG